VSKPLAFIDEVGEEAAEKITLSLKYAYNDLLNEMMLQGGPIEYDEYDDDDDEDDEYESERD